VVGPYYTGLLSRVNEVLANLSTYFPGYTGGGYEIAGFGWHQGWNDRGVPAYNAEYEANLTNLIEDLRTDLAVPNLPVVVANTGMSNADSSTIGLSLVTAQNNVGDPAKHPEFAGTVTTVDTRPFDYGELLGTANNQAYHWNFNAESYFNIGESMGKAMLAMRPAALSSARDILNFEFPGLPAASFSGTHISVAVPWGADVSALAPTHTVSPLATCAPVSGAVRDFSTPQTYTVTAQDGSTQAYTVTVVPGPSPFDTWAGNPAQGLTAGLNDGPNDDPDFDGIENQLEFVLGGAPMGSSQTPLPALTQSSGSWIFAYNRSAASRPPATTQTVEYGDSLSDWTQLPIPEQSAGAVTITPGSSSDRVEVIIPSPGAKGFVRLKVSQ
jgi:Carbohydrate esterase, sialic acid-specific acetylesterase